MFCLGGAAFRKLRSLGARRTFAGRSPGLRAANNRASIDRLKRPGLDSAGRAVEEALGVLLDGAEFLDWFVEPEGSV